MASNHITVNGRHYTQRQAEDACALYIYMGKSDETIGTILGGIGGPPIHCAGLVSHLRARSHAVYNRVYNDPAYWEARANRLYREWMGAASQIVRQYGARIPLSDPPSQHANFFLIALASEANSTIFYEWNGGSHSSTLRRQIIWSYGAFARLEGALEMLFALV